MAYDYVTTLAVTSSGLSLNLLSTSYAAFNPVSVLFVNSTSGDPAYVRLGSTTVSSSNGFPLVAGATFSRTLACLDAQSRQAWQHIAITCETSSSGQTASVLFYASAV